MIKHLLELKSANSSGGGGGRNGGGTQNTDTQKRRISQLQAAVKGKWIPGHFCSTHGHGVGPDHDSKTCANKSSGHVETATRANPFGPGANRNKGWDDWLNSA